MSPFLFRKQCPYSQPRWCPMNCRISCHHQIDSCFAVRSAAGGSILVRSYLSAWAIPRTWWVTPVRTNTRTTRVVVIGWCGAIGVWFHDWVELAREVYDVHPPTTSQNVRLITVT
eukprot:c3257_g1_i2.p1 GENE.c3257_g1_i2~~c3257_g1_i2.p1  ORF type:complete len:115 (+),score=10.06 c3257_g1_i2:738-1082(+)